MSEFGVSAQQCSVLVRAVRVPCELDLFVLLQCISQRLEVFLLLLRSGMAGVSGGSG